MEYKSKNHAKFLIIYHLTMVCKYRKKLLLPYGKVVKDLFWKIAAHSDFAGCRDGSGPGSSALFGQKQPVHRAWGHCPKIETRIDLAFVGTVCSRIEMLLLEGKDILE
jgi:hypothetical protein